MSKQHTFLRALTLGAALNALAFSLMLPAPVSAQPPPPAAEGEVVATPETGSAGDAVILSPSAGSLTAFAPVIAKNWPLDTVFGIETANLTPSASGIFGANPSWIRRNSLIWKDVEPTEGARNWGAAAAVEADMIAASSRNVRLIVIVHGTPTWAQQIAGSTCGPIRNDKIAAFATFMRDVVAKYSKPPYNVKYWEIWNEPDAPTSISAPGIQYGCWGNPADPYGGGGYYASVLSQVAPQIRQVDPQAKVVLGGLLLGCNPNSPPAGGCTAGRYLEGILRAGGATHFDVVSFHAYDYFNDTANAVGGYNGGREWGTAWNTTGPVLIAKTQFVKSVLNQFGVTGKALVNTESGLLCFFCAARPSNFEVTKAYYVPQAYAAAIAEGLAGNVWYSWEGWFFSELIDPAYTAFKTANSILLDAKYTGQVSAGEVGASGVRGYKFTRDGKQIWVIWSLDGATKNVTLSPGAPAVVTDALGAAQPASASFALTVKPLYIQWP